MHQGLHTAVNIHQKILSSQRNQIPHFKELDSKVPPTMGLAVGKKAASYSPQAGTSSGEEVMRMFFGDDLGFTSMVLSFVFLFPFLKFQRIGSKHTE